LAPVIIALIIAARAYLEYQRIVSVDWDRIQVVSQNGFVWVTNAITHISSTNEMVSEEYLVLMDEIFPILIKITPSNQMAFGDPKHCH
jgi:hypothetical protein